MKHKLLKYINAGISVILTITLLWQEVMWAHPDDFEHLQPLAYGEGRTQAAGE